MAFRFRSYLSNVNGNTSMIFAVSMMSLVVASGVAIDFGQMVTAKTSANAIADAAALAAVSLSNGTESEMKRIAKDYVDTNTKMCIRDSLCRTFDRRRERNGVGRQRWP